MNLGVFLYHNETLEVPSQVVRDDFVAGGREELKKLTTDVLTPRPRRCQGMQRFSRKENDYLGSILNMSFYHKFSFPSSCQHPIELFLAVFFSR